MVTALDAADYILSQVNDRTTAMKLEKLTYYAQAWHITWTGRPLFDDRVEAWAQGPVAPVLFAAHRTQLIVTRVPGGESQQVADDERDVIDAVLKFYAGFNAEQLSEMTHNEDPWRQARAGLPANAWSKKEITPNSMRRFYTRQIIMEERVPVAPDAKKGHFRSSRVRASADEQKERWAHTLDWLASR